MEVELHIHRYATHTVVTGLAIDISEDQFTSVTMADGTHAMLWVHHHWTHDEAIKSVEHIESTWDYAAMTEYTHDRRGALLLPPMVRAIDKTN